MPDWLLWLYSYIQDYLTVSIPGVTDMFFAANTVYLILVVVSFVYLYSRRDKLRNGYKLLFAFSILALVLIIYNPLSRLEFYLFPSASDAVFARFWLLCPVWLVVAFAADSCVFESKNKWFKHAGIVALTAVLIFSGKTVDLLSMTNDPDNTYKIRSESVDLADGIMELSEGRPVKLFIMIPDDEYNGKFKVEGSVAEGIAQYNGYIDIYPVFFSDEEWNDYYVSEMTPDNEATSEYYINKTLMYKYLQYHFDYVAWPADELIAQKMERCGFELLGEYGGFNIFSYHISDESVQIAESLLELSGGKPTSALMVSFEDQMNVWVGIRYYSDDIVIRSARLNTDNWASYSSDSERTSYLGCVLDSYEESMDFEYVVWPDENDISGFMEGCGYKAVCVADGYSIFAKDNG